MRAYKPLLLAKLLAGLLLRTTSTYAQKINIHEIQEAQQQFHEIQHASDAPFLSATLKTELSPVPTAIKSNQKTLLANSLVQFLQRVFDDQQVYDVEIVGVAIFEEQVLEVETGGEHRSIMDITSSNKKQKQKQKHQGRKLVLNSLQAGQFHFQRDDDDGYNFDDEEDEGSEKGDEKEWDEIENLVEKEGSSGGGYTLRFAAVISAEHTKQQLLSHGDFQTMLIHICHKFDTHLVEFVSGINDEYFENVNHVAVSGYETDLMEAKMKAKQEHEAAAEGSAGGLKFEAEILDETNNGTADESSGSKKMSAVTISGIILGCLFLVPLAFAAVKFYRREQRLKVTRWRTQEIATAYKSSIKSLRVLYNKPQDDDYSFNPLGTDNGYNGESIPRFYRDNEDGLLNREDETFSFGNQTSFPASSILQQSSHDDNDRANTSSTKKSIISQQEHQHVYAPPGKVGVAIDVVDGYPIVHKVKRGSPLEGLLKPNDMVMAIDDVDTTRMSAADVTHLMVKRMNYQRKITFVRKDHL